MIQYNNIRQTLGSRNLIVAQRMNTETIAAEIFAYVELDRVEDFQRHKYPTSYLWTVLHKLLGHGTGKMMTVDSNGNFNFDKMKLPINPLTGSPITS